MIRIVTLIIMCSMAFCAGTVYVSYGSEATANLTYDGSTDDTSMDTAPITLGFSYPVYMDAAGKIKGSVGGSYDIAPMEDSAGLEIGFMTIFGSASYAISEGLSSWASAGICMPSTDDLDDLEAESGIHIGVGVRYSINDKISTSIGYSSNSVESPASALLGDYYDFLDLGNLEWEFTTVTVSLEYNL